MNFSLCVGLLASCLLPKLLGLQKLEKMATFLHKLGMCTLLDHAATTQYDDLVRISNRGKAMGNGYSCSVLGDSVERALDSDFGFSVERGGSFVEEENYSAIGSALNSQWYK